MKIPYRLLLPLIVVFCFVGVYSLNNNFYELLIMVFFGFIGYILRKIGYDSGPFLLGMVLGPMMETSFRQSLTISQGELVIFFQRPFSAVLLILVFLLIFLRFLKVVRIRRVLWRKRR